MFVNQLQKHKEDKNLTWRSLEDATGMSTQNIQKIAKYGSQEEIMKMPLGTYLMLKDKLSVDMLK
jgi:DNA-binding Xre family transcriptional regulator